ncbi:hypothetical protein BDV12DRAFT_181504 [Aspergillus spectabilis]
MIVWYSGVGERSLMRSALRVLSTPSTLLRIQPPLASRRPWTSNNRSSLRLTPLSVR